MLKIFSSEVFRKALGAVSILFTGTFVMSALGFVTQILLARLLPVGDFGRFAALLVTVNFLTPLASAGVGSFLLQVFGRELWGATRWLRPSANLVLLMTAGSCLGLAIYVCWSDIGVSGRLLASTAAICVLLGQVAVELASSRFQVESRYGALTLWQATTQAGRFVIVGANSLASLSGMEALLTGYAAIGVLTTFGGLAVLRGLWQKNLRLPVSRQAKPSQTHVDGRPSMRDALLGASPFALTTVFYVLFFQSGIVMLDLLAGGKTAAAFSAAFLIVAAIDLIPQVIYTRFLVAKLYFWGAHDRQTFAAAFHVGVVLMTVSGVLLMALVALCAPYVLTLLFGARYASASVVLMILSASIPLRFASTVYSSLFVSRQEMHRKVRYLGLAALTTFAVNLALVPVFGTPAAAIANVAAELAMLLLSILGTARHIEGIDIVDTFRASTLRASLHHLIGPRGQDGGSSYVVPDHGR